jgi:zinc transport system permease protein
MVPEILQNTFMVRAFIAGIVVGVTAPTIGVFLVAKRYSLIADSLAHVALAGVALALLLNIYPIYGALAVTLAASLIIEKLRFEQRVPADAALAMFLSGGLALAIVLIAYTRGLGVGLFSILFGSITTVSPTDVWAILVMGAIVAGTVVLLYKEFFYLSFDEETAVVSGIPSRLLNFALAALAAITVTVAIRIIGVLLIGALMVIPVVTAIQVARGFRQTIFLASGFGLLAVIAGLFLAYYLDLPAGGAIVLFALFIFGAVRLSRQAT